MSSKDNLLGTEDANDLSTDLLRKLIQIIGRQQTRNTRECLEQLRQLFLFVSSKTDLLRSTSDQFSETIFTIIIDPQVHFKIRTLAAYLFQCLFSFSGREPEMIKQSIRNFGGGSGRFDQNKTQSQFFQNIVVLLPLLSTLGSESSLDSNVANYIHWFVTQSVEYRSFTLPSLLIIARYHSILLKSINHIKPLESQLSDYLSKANLINDQKNSKSFFSKLTSNDTISELDGSVAKPGDLFTVLNTSQQYSDELISNVHAFSGLYSWLYTIYDSQLKDSTESSSEDKKLNERNSIPNGLKESIITYCQRLIDQSKLKQSNQTNSASNIRMGIVTQSSPIGNNTISNINEDILPEVCLMECIRIFDLLCLMDNSLVPRLFPVIKKMFNMNSLRSNATIFLALLQYFINHSDVAVYDPEPVFRVFFEEFLSKNYTNPVISFEVLTFCMKNRKKLLHSTNVFSTYFPPLLKVFAWNPRTFVDDMASLIPLIMNGNSYIKLLHSILDMPLLCSALESVHLQQFEDKENNSVGSSNPSSYEQTAFGANSEFRVLYNHLLRNESGGPINFWGTTTLPIIQKYCKETPITPRIIEICKIVPYLLSIYFDVLISESDETHLNELVPILFQRIDQLFPLEVFQKEVRKVIEVKILSIFHRFPNFLISLKDLIIELIADSGSVNSGSRQELQLNLCWMIGEYSSKSVLNVTTELLNEYYEALELFAYERLSVVKLENEDGNRDGASIEYSNRLMLTIISSLSKLASRWQALTSRLLICLAKIQRHHLYFDSSVITRANECAILLKLPSVAFSTLDLPHKTGRKLTTHVDNNTSLPFMLESTAGNNLEIQPIKLHPFLPSQ